MKKLFFILVFVCGITTATFAQNKETYTLLELTEVVMGKTTLKIYYEDGKEENYGEDKGLKLANRLGYNASVVVTAFNYLASKGYEYVNATVTVVGTNIVVTNYIFKKEN